MLLWIALPVWANGRPPDSTDIHLSPSGDRMLVPVTFGLLVVDGTEERWVCEQAVGYGGTYDPDYVLTSDGRILATTYDGLRVSTDGGCTFGPLDAPFGAALVGDLVRAPDGRLWATTWDTPSTVWVSTDEGLSWVENGPSRSDVWWLQLGFDPSDAQRMSLTGLVLDSKDPRAGLLMVSTDAGEAFIETATTGVVPGDGRLLYTPGFTPGGDALFVRVSDSTGDRLYRSADLGNSWQPALTVGGALTAWAALDGGDVLIAGGATVGTWRSTDRGATWGMVEEGPALWCATPGGAGLLGCGGLGDGYAVAESADLGLSWTPRFALSEIEGPLDCPAGTVQKDLCERSIWPAYAALLGIDLPEDTAPPDSPNPDDSAPAPGEPPDEDDPECGCGTAGAQAPRGAFAVLALSAVALARRRT